MAKMLRHKETGETFIYTTALSALSVLELVTEDPVAKVIAEMAAQDVANAPAVEVPAVEVPAVEVPAVEVPAVEVPAVEVPAVEAKKEVAVKPALQKRNKAA